MKQQTWGNRLRAASGRPASLAAGGLGDGLTDASREEGRHGITNLSSAFFAIAFEYNPVREGLQPGTLPDRQAAILDRMSELPAREAVEQIGRASCRERV